MFVIGGTSFEIEKIACVLNSANSFRRKKKKKCNTTASIERLEIPTAPYPLRFVVFSSCHPPMVVSMVQIPRNSARPVQPQASYRGAITGGFFGASSVIDPLFRQQDRLKEYFGWVRRVRVGVAADAPPRGSCKMKYHYLDQRLFIHHKIHPSLPSPMHAVRGVRGLSLHRDAGRLSVALHLGLDGREECRMAYQKSHS